MSHVRHEERAVLIRNLAEARVIQIARIAAHAGNDELGLEERGAFLQCVVVDEAGGRIHLVRRKKIFSFQQCCGLRSASQPTPPTDVSTIPQLGVHDTTVLFKYK